jgi:2'-5' RNA ligase
MLLEFAESAPEGTLDEVLLAGGISSRPVTYYQSSMLNGATAPGAKAVGRLVQRPSQTVGASPPLPPGVSLPTPKELHALGDDISSIGVKGDLINGAAKHAHAAATKMAASNPIEALRMLRSAQTGIVSAHRDYNASQVPIANVFTASLNPAEASSARAEMYAGLDKRLQFRRLATECAAHIDRIRRCTFHGMYNHSALARFAGGDAPATDSGMIYLMAPTDLMPDDITISKPGHLTVVYLGNITPQRFQDVCERAKAAAQSMPPLHGTMGGLGLFSPTEASSGKQVAYIPVYADGLYRLRILLRDLAAPESQPEFVPHITLAYLEPGDPMPEPITSARICFSQLYVCRGDEVKAFAFTGQHEPHDSGRHMRDRAGHGEAALTNLDKVLALTPRGRA